MQTCGWFLPLSRWLAAQGQYRADPKMPVTAHCCYAKVHGPQALETMQSFVHAWAVAAGMCISVNALPNERRCAPVQDGTLVNVKGRSKFPKDADDWKWFNKKTADKVKSYHQDGYKVVIFTWVSGTRAMTRRSSKLSATCACTRVV